MWEKKTLIGKNPCNQVGAETIIFMHCSKVWGGIRTVVHRAEKQGKKPLNQPDPF